MQGVWSRGCRRAQVHIPNGSVGGHGATQNEKEAGAGAGADADYVRSSWQSLGLCGSCFRLISGSASSTQPFYVKIPGSCTCSTNGLSAPTSSQSYGAPIS